MKTRTGLNVEKTNAKQETLTGFHMMKTNNAQESYTSVFEF